MITCKRCSLEKEPDKHNPHLCVDCVRAENTRVSHFRNHNYNWMEVAKEADLQLWERQPGETDHEWSVWLRYRDAYPSKRPSYRQVAEELNTTVGAVKKIGMRWSFTTRLQAWAKHIDEITLESRRQQIIDMNKKHVDMATKLNDKLMKAIDNIDPYALEARDINSLFKTAAELERKALLDKSADQTVITSVDDNPELKKVDVDSGNIKEILQVLGGAGVLSNFGVRQTTTTTTEVVVQDED